MQLLILFCTITYIYSDWLEYVLRWNVMDQLRAKIKKNKLMIRRAAPVTIESTGFAKLSRGIERICLKIKEKRKI